MKLLENLHCYIWPGKGNNCNSYLFARVLRGDRPHVLIDPGGVITEVNERCLDILISAMRKDGIQPEDIGLIINTHAHHDHFGANRALLEQARVRPGKPSQPLIAIYEGESAYLKVVLDYMAKWPGPPMSFEPSFYLKEGELSLGAGNKLTLQVLHTPGHTPGSICLYWPDKRVLITGDVVFYGGIGRTDLPYGDGKALKRSIERLAELEVDYLLPGHKTELGAIISGRDQVRQNFASLRLTYFPML